MNLTDTFQNERNYWSHLYEVQKQGRLIYSENENGSHLWGQEVKGGESLGAVQGATNEVFPPPLLRYNWPIKTTYLRCTTWGYDTYIQWEIITTIKLFRVVTSSLFPQGLCFFIPYLRNPFLSRSLIIFSHCLWKVTNFCFLVSVFNPVVIYFYECCEQETFFATEKRNYKQNKNQGNTN